MWFNMVFDTCLKEIKRKATPIFHDFQQHSTNLFTYLDDALESNHWKGNQKPITEQKQAIQLLWDQITDEFRSFLALLDQEDTEQLAKHAKKINQLWRESIEKDRNAQETSARILRQAPNAQC
jgi:hypothetical protein